MLDGPPTVRSMFPQERKAAKAVNFGNPCHFGLELGWARRVLVSTFTVHLKTTVFLEHLRSNLVKCHMDLLSLKKMKGLFPLPISQATTISGESAATLFCWFQHPWIPSLSLMRRAGGSG